MIDRLIIDKKVKKKEEEEEGKGKEREDDYNVTFFSNFIS